MKWGPMKPHRRRRLILIGGLLVAIGSAIGFTLQALNNNINLFYPPDQIVSGQAPKNERIRAGGMVADGSTFEMRYEGILPDLFREGQGIVATGYLTEAGHFEAEEVLAKHDENYMPPELAGIAQMTSETAPRVD